MECLSGLFILLSGWRRALAAFLAGALAAFAQAPFDFFAACFISFPILVWLIDGAVPYPPRGFLKQLLPAFGVGWWFGFGYFLAGLWWIGAALLVEAESFAWLLPFAVLGIPALLAVFWGLAAGLARLLWSGALGRILALAFAFGVAEWLREHVATGFPWNAIGYAAMPVPLLMQSDALIGLTGMNALAVLVFAMPALLAGRRHKALGLSLAAILAAAHIGYGYVRLAAPAPAADRTLALRLVQPSIDQSEKWDRDVRDRIFKELLDLSRQPPVEGAAAPKLILWPETSVPFLFSERPDALPAIGDMLSDGQMLLVGAVRSEDAGTQGSPRYYNSVVAIDDSGEIVDAVDKVHLVPFGEYLPFSSLLGAAGLTKLVQVPLDFSPGARRHTIALPGGTRGLPFVCYEIIFPDLVGVDLTSTDVLVNVTNDAWFGETPGPYQHLRQAQLRTVETGLPLVRAANNGISAVIDARGRIVDALALNARGVIDVSLPIERQRPSGGNPRLAGLAILLLLGMLALLLKAIDRVRPG